MLTDGTLLSLDRMGALLDADPASGLVRVEAGIRLHALSEALAEHGLAMPNLGDIDEQSIAGAISTATHGTGVDAAQRLRAGARAAPGHGRRRRCVDVDGGEDLLAARVAVGALGVVTEVTLQTVPAFTLRGVDAPVALAEVLDGLDARVDGHRHFEFFVFPHADSALTRTNDVVDEPPAAAAAVARLGRRRPARQPRLPAGVRHRPRVPAARSRRSTAS